MPAVSAMWVVVGWTTLNGPTSYHRLQICVQTALIRPRKPAEKFSKIFRWAKRFRNRVDQSACRPRHGESLWMRALRRDHARVLCVAAGLHLSWAPNLHRGHRLEHRPGETPYPSSGAHLTRPGKRTTPRRRSRTPHMCGERGDERELPGRHHTVRGRRFSAFLGANSGCGRRLCGNMKTLCHVRGADGMTWYRYR